MSTPGFDDHMAKWTVPEIRVDGEPAYRGKNTGERHWNTAYDRFPSPEPRFDTGETEDLEDRLWKKAVNHASGDNSLSFWPPGILKTIVTKQAITNEILRVSPDHINRGQAEILAERVRQHESGKCVQIFTILVLLDQVKLLVDHILSCRRGVRDHDLPLMLTGQGTYKKRLCRADSETVCCFSGWKNAGLESFDRFQRRLAVPVFRLERQKKTLIHLDLDTQEILPWCDEAEVPPISAMSGGAGTVIRVRIDPRCHEFHDILRAINVAGGIFAVKRLRERTFDKFRSEVEALKKFDGTVHPHLVTLLATFTQAGYYHMIFPWAECDLDLYWANNPHPSPRDVELVRWLSRQCLGIMEAVSVIHNPGHLTSDKKFGRHGDIKAENILWFKSRPDDPHDRGILVLSDLGLTAINSDKSRSMQPNTGLKMTPAYRPPECDIRGGTISRAFDIWTLGCLYLELVCWLLRGKKGKDDFDEVRTTPFIFGTRTDVYFDIEERKYTAPNTYVFKVKDVVFKTISELHNDRYCSQWVHELLELVEKDMLVVLSNKRKTSQVLLETLRRMDDRVQSDVWYSTRSAPQKRTWERHVGVIAELNEAAKKHVDDNGVRTHDSDDQPLQHWEDLGERVMATGSVSFTDTSTGISHRNTFDRRPASGDLPPTDSGYTSARAGSNFVEYAKAPDLPPSVKIIAEEDNMTEYSTTSSIHPQSVDRHISAMVEGLINMVPQSTAGDSNIMARLATILPNLLKAFALMIGHCADTSLHRDIMYSVHKHRNVIVKKFRNAMEDEDEATPKPRPGMSLEEKMHNWRDESPNYEEDEQWTESDSYRDEDEDAYGDGSEEEADDEMRRATETRSTHKNCLVNSPAYHWLRNALAREIFLAPAVPDIRDLIRHGVLCSLPPLRVSRRRDAESYDAIFEMDWDPRTFIEQQNYDEASSDPIGMAITLTASSQDTQALTARQYISQVWPSIGEHAMRVIQGVCNGDWKEERHTTLPDKTTVKARSVQSTFTVIAHGSATTIAELGELLSWLGAALRPSPREDGIVYCTPHIKKLNDQQFTPPVLPPKELHFEIGFTFTEDDAAFPNGKCWHSMFRNPVVVRGFPIVKRAATETGLEMSLDMMACIVRAKRIVPFGGTYYFKGFSSMLALEAQKEGTFIWHHLHKPDGQHISYFDHKSALSKIPTYQQLENARHVVGWCSKINFYAGAVDMDYSIGDSSLPRPHRTCVLDKISISGGKFVSAGVGISLGRAQTPVHIARDTYFEKMNWIGKRYAILWDEGKNRGWLVNGPSALLHLVLASLHYDLCGKLKSSILFQKERLKLPMDHRTANSALEILTEQENKQLEIHIDKVEKWTEETAGEGDAPPTKITKTKTTYTRFEDRVEKIYCLLEQAMEHQASIEGKDGLDLKLRLRKHLEGWEFRDFAAGEDYIYPRVKTLQTLAKGWVDFTTEINAITIFGKGFGEIIRPANADSVCGFWTLQLEQKYYLAACMSDLKDAPGIVFKAHEVNFGKNLVWKVPDNLFKPCKCVSDGTGNADHSHLVQVLTPQGGKSYGIPRSTGQFQPEGQGAIIFGYNPIYPLLGKDKGDPEEEQVKEN